MYKNILCSICGATKLVFSSPSRVDRGKFCSKTCYYKSRKGMAAWNKGKPANWAKGNKHRLGKTITATHKESISKANSGLKNSQWKGDDVKYRALHHWVTRTMGRPMECQHCLQTDLKPRQYHWANKSGSYLRSEDDWLRLCVKCHKLYDKSMHI